MMIADVGTKPKSNVMHHLREFMAGSWTWNAPEGIPHDSREAEKMILEAKLNYLFAEEKCVRLPKTAPPMFMTTITT